MSVAAIVVSEREIRVNPERRRTVRNAGVVFLELEVGIAAIDVRIREIWVKLNRFRKILDRGLVLL